MAPRGSSRQEQGKSNRKQEQRARGSLDNVHDDSWVRLCAEIQETVELVGQWPDEGLRSSDNQAVSSLLQAPDPRASWVLPSLLVYNLRGAMH